MSYKLLSVPNGYSTDVALVIAPYVDLVFLKDLVARLNPARLCLLVDDAIQPEALHKIRDCRRRGFDIEVRVARATGLMHMKAFFFEFVRNEAPRRRKRRLLFGSANATNAAFNGRVNAELIAESDLMINEDADIANYFSQILSTFDSPKEHAVGAFSGWLSQQPILHLPKFRSAPPDKATLGFDAWLQRGVLAAQYRNAPQFAILNIKLKKALPQDLVAQIFARSSFTEQGERNVVRYAYLNGADDVDAEDAEAEQSNWKARFAVWTHLGDWVSYDCHSAHREIMKSKSSATRNRNISQILRHEDDDPWIESRIEQLLAGLHQVWTELKGAKVSPGDYLESRNGGLNPVPYRERFLLKQKQDLLLAQDEDFKKRYINGFEFPAMPRFRQDTMAWEAFVRSWCESIAVEAVKSRTTSLVAKQIKRAMTFLKTDLSELSPLEIERVLRKHWGTEWDGKNMTVGEVIACYHEE